MQFTKLFPGKYFKAADLDDGEITLTIMSVSMEEIGEDGEKPVLRFDGADQGLVLNMTNAEAIANMHGGDTDNWIGSDITLFKSQTRMGNKTVDCVRVK